jgi:hypothetical protein
MTTIEVRFRRVSTGLKLVLSSIFVTLVSLPLSAWARFNPEHQDDPGLLLALTSIGWLSTVLEIIGQILCASVPAKVGATGLIRAVIAFTAIGIALGVASELTANDNGPGWLELSANACSVAGALLFVVFLGRLASYLGDSRSLEKARFLFFGAVAMLAAIFAIWISSPARAAIATMPLVIGLIVFGIYLCFVYGILLNTIRRDVDRALTDDGPG